MGPIKERLGFPDAHVAMLEDGSYLVAVVDPAHKKCVQWRPTPAGSGRLPAGWSAPMALAENDFMAFQAAALGWTLFRKEGADKAAAESLLGPEEGEKARPIWEFIASQRGPEACDTAVWTLGHDARAGARMLAAAVLLNFHERDVAWWSLADGLRDSEDRVKGACQQVLQIFGRDHARSVDWGPAVPALRAVLDGTHLDAVVSLAKVLLATGIRADLGSALVGEAGEGLLVFVPSTKDSFAAPAHDLLQRLTGEDHRKDVVRWRRCLTAIGQQGTDSRAAK
jgi:hypothetical protein